MCTFEHRGVTTVMLLQDCYRICSTVTTTRLEIKQLVLVEPNTVVIETQRKVSN